MVPNASEGGQLNPVLDRRQRCPWCGKRTNFVTDRLGGQIICGVCGLVVEDRTQEVSTELGASRMRDNLTAYSITKPDMGLATVIGYTSLDGSGRAVSGNLGPSMERLRMWDYRSQAHSQADRSLKRAMGELEKLSEKVVVPEAVVEKAAYIYRKSIPLISTRGRSIATLVAASLYAACRSTQTPRTLKDIGEAANLDRLDIARSYRLLVTENELPQPVTDPSKSVSRIAYGAGLSTKVERRGLEILKKADREGALTGNSPMGSAAASLYIASVLEGERSTKTHLAMVAGVTNVTIRNRCKVLISILGLDPLTFDDTRARRKVPPMLTVLADGRQT
jgi:transcription initiation factor TFIIB